MNEQPSTNHGTGYSPSFETVVLTKLATLGNDIQTMKEGQAEARKSIQEIQITLADRRNHCPLVAKAEKRLLAQLLPIQQGIQMVKGGYRTVVLISMAVTVTLGAIYHMVSIWKIAQAAPGR
jgi:hypothetical protein